ncbi:ARPP-1 family domain-containing protein [Yinghuangia soli]|uniref:ARG and Rhodanese-Phosphatase-superfamily-associated domain-containing protein n=1 Tax=Yinghuangia soli TaxID=2908204 RepID=A0AA41U032_9ACTN|nr:DUF6569 family protein [Yinghuangia soli]MCF2529408.1 hypothetical protein [Yinghuangia soli]
MRNPLRKLKRSAAEQATVGELLSGTTTGRVQSAGRMQVLPLLAGDAPTTNLGDPAALGISTGDYGTLKFRNDGPDHVLVPSHLAVMVSQKAQDHAMPRATLVGPGADLPYNAAMCIQQSQGGLISDGRHRLAVLPPSVREAASAMPAKPGYDRLWPAVARFKSSAGLPGSADLVRFMKHFADELDQFVAEFENVEDQIGAVVLMDGEVLGVERAPSHAYWNTMWEPLIRFCYGAEAVRREAAGVPASPVTRAPLATPAAGGDGADPFSALAAALRAADTAEQGLVETATSEAAAQSVVVGVDESAADLAVGTVIGERLVGAYALAGGTPVYASLTARNTLG